MSKPFLGFLQASGLVGYVILISMFFKYIPKKLDDGSSEFLAPIIMLLLFVISAVMSSSIVLGSSAVLFWERKYSDAFSLVAWTVGWEIFYFALLITLLCVN